MKTPNVNQMKACPKCGNSYSEPSSLSREDGTTAICPDCGTREALAGIGICEEEQELILETIHRHRQGADSDSG